MARAEPPAWLRARPSSAATAANGSTCPPREHHQTASGTTPTSTAASRTMHTCLALRSLKLNAGERTHHATHHQRHSLGRAGCRRCRRALPRMGMTTTHKQRRFVDADRTRLVVLHADGNATLATRHTADHTWGPPTTLTEEPPWPSLTRTPGMKQACDSQQTRTPGLKPV